MRVSDKKELTKEQLKWFDDQIHGSGENGKFLKFFRDLTAVEHLTFYKYNCQGITSKEQCSNFKDGICSKLRSECIWEEKDERTD